MMAKKKLFSVLLVRHTISKSTFIPSVVIGHAGFQEALVKKTKSSVCKMTLNS